MIRQGIAREWQSRGATPISRMAMRCGLSMSRTPRPRSWSARSPRLGFPAQGSGLHFTLLPAPVSTALAPGVAGSLAYSDTQGLRTELSFSANAVTQTTSLVLTPTLAPSGANVASAGHAFDLTAARAGVE